LTDFALSGVGEALARERQTQGLALTDVAQQLKFALRHIEAIEQERFETLPGGTFARGMVRNYARLLKLDPEPLLERISGRFEAPDTSELAARFSQPVPFSDSGRRSTLLYLALSISVLGFVGFIAYEWHHEANPPPQTAAAEPMRSAPIPAQPAGASPEPVIVDQSVQPDKELSPSGAADAVKNVPGGGRVVMHCDQESWIEVKDAAGRVLISSLNPAGSERVVQGRPPFALVIGNAQHVRVSYNNQPVDLQPHIKVEVARLTLR
jgi:cytoskeleton protein RodZ